ncbi:Uncharacterised protein [Mycobacterium tuberculosis]|nr:Uncharacterised protein [Mycobacterium tuberculosis]
MVCSPVGGATPPSDVAKAWGTAANSCAPDAPHIAATSGTKKSCEIFSNLPIW